MRNVLKSEWNRAINGVYFKITMIAGLIFAFLSAIEAFRLTYLWQLNNGVLGAEGLYPFTITEVWVGMNQAGMCNYLYMLLFPMFAVLPYALASFDDKKSGYINQILIRVSRKTFYLARYLVTFLLGGIGVIVPSVVNVMLGALYAPIMPQSLSNAQCGITDDMFASEILFEHPVIYVLIFTMLHFVWGGLFATMAISIVDIVNNKYVLLAAPFLLHVITYCMTYYSATFVSLGLYSIVPYIFLNAIQPWGLEIVPVSLFTFLIFLLTYGFVVLYNESRDVL